MNYKLFKYLKKNGLADPFQVNSLFVSAFVKEKGWHVERCSIITNLLDFDKKKLQSLFSSSKKMVLHLTWRI